MSLLTTSQVDASMSMSLGFTLVFGSDLGLVSVVQLHRPPCSYRQSGWWLARICEQKSDELGVRESTRAPVSGTRTGGADQNFRGKATRP